MDLATCTLESVAVLLVEIWKQDIRTDILTNEGNFNYGLKYSVK